MSQQAPIVRFNLNKHAQAIMERACQSWRTLTGAAPAAGISGDALAGISQVWVRLCNSASMGENRQLQGGMLHLVLWVFLDPEVHLAARQGETEISLYITPDRAQLDQMELACTMFKYIQDAADACGQRLSPVAAIVGICAAYLALLKKQEERTSESLAGERR